MRGNGRTSGWKGSGRSTRHTAQSFRWCACRSLLGCSARPVPAHSSVKLRSTADCTHAPLTRLCQSSFTVSLAFRSAMTNIGSTCSAAGLYCSLNGNGGAAQEGQLACKPADGPAMESRLSGGSSSGGSRPGADTRVFNAFKCHARFAQDRPYVLLFWE